MAFALVTVASGARSLRSLEHGETFHPVVGPMIEAQGLHVAQSRLVERAREMSVPLVIWDVGLGAAANAIAVMEAFRGVAAHVELHSFDCSLEPLVFAREHAAELDYLTPWLPSIDALLSVGRARAGAVDWHFHDGDFRTIPTAPAPHAILYDPYSPAANPGLWTLEHFTRLRKVLREPCTLTSYSRSTAVRVTLALAGFYVGRGSATGEKDQTTVAATHCDLLAAPLDAAWLGRVRRSTRGAALREGVEPGPISEEDFRTLSAGILFQ